MIYLKVLDFLNLFFLGNFLYLGFINYLCFHLGFLWLILSNFPLVDYLNSIIFPIISISNPCARHLLIFTLDTIGASLPL